MRKTFLIFLVFAGMTKMEGQKNIIKIAPSVTNIGVQYERLLTKHLSVLAQVGKGFGYTGIATGGNHLEESGATYIVEARYYFSSKRDNMEGWYVAPSIKRVAVNRNSTYHPALNYRVFEGEPDPFFLYYNSAQDYFLNTVREDRTINYNIYCLTTGRQWVFNSKLTFGFSAGIGYQKDLYKDNSFSTGGSYTYSTSGSSSSSGSENSLPIALQIGLSVGYAF
ncbi:MAG: hypothetical protein RL494_618 [Bacteroidota bacterium]|jgi:hypothetical protein